MYGIKVSNTVVLSLFLSVLRVLFVEDISKEYTFMNILVSSKLILHSEQQSSLLRKKNAFFWYSILPVHGNDKYFDARKKKWNVWGREREIWRNENVGISLILRGKSEGGGHRKSVRSKWES